MSIIRALYLINRALYPINRPLHSLKKATTLPVRTRGVAYFGVVIHTPKRTYTYYKPIYLQGCMWGHMHTYCKDATPQALTSPEWGECLRCGMLVVCVHM